MKYFSKHYFGIFGWIILVASLFDESYYGRIMAGFGITFIGIQEVLNELRKDN